MPESHHEVARDDRRQAQLDRVEPIPATLLALLLGPAPACLGTAPSHDDTVHGETTADRDRRHTRALALCTHCPALPGCRAAVADLGPITGVWAGQVFVPSSRAEYVRTRRAEQRQRAEQEHNAMSTASDIAGKG